MVISQFDVFMVSLTPDVPGHGIKARPCVVVSPDEINHHLGSVIVVPLTSVVRLYPTRVPIRFRGRQGEVVVDQVRAVDVARIWRKLGRVDAATGERVLAVLREMFDHSPSRRDMASTLESVDTM